MFGGGKSPAEVLVDGGAGWFVLEKGQPRQAGESSKSLQKQAHPHPQSPERSEAWQSPTYRKTALTLGARTDDFQNVVSSDCAISGLLQATVLTEQAVKQILSSTVTFVIVGHKPQAAWPDSRRETCVNIPMFTVIFKTQPQLGSFPERMER